MLRLSRGCRRGNHTAPATCGVRRAMCDVRCGVRGAKCGARCDVRRAVQGTTCWELEADSCELSLLELRIRHVGIALEGLGETQAAGEVAEQTDDRGGAGLVHQRLYGSGALGVGKGGGLLIHACKRSFEPG